MVVLLDPYSSHHSFDPIDAVAVAGHGEYLKKCARDLAAVRYPHYPEETPLNTRQIRMLASVGFESEDAVGEQIIGMLFPRNGFRGTWQQYLNTPLRDISQRNIDKVFAFYGLSQECPPLFNVQDLITWIVDVKHSGLTIEESLEAMSCMVHQFLQREGRLSLAARQLLERFEDAIAFNSRLNPLSEQLMDYVDMEMYGRAQRTLSKLVSAYMEQIESSQGELLGSLIPLGWCGHLIVMEVRKVETKYVVSLCQVGGDLGYARDGKMQAVRAFVIEDVDAMEEKLWQAFWIRNISFENFDEGLMACYGVFSDCQEVPLHRLPKRPAQNIGNCGVRSFIEMLIWSLQRAGEHDVATRFIEHIDNFCWEHAPDYPAFKLAFVGREPIKPLDVRFFPSYVLA